MPKRIRQHDDAIYALRVNDRLTVVVIASRLGISKTLVAKRLTAMGVNTVACVGRRSANNYVPAKKAP